MPRPFAPEEDRLAGLLARAGLSRLAARCLVALLRHGHATALEAADASGLARQEVSLGMRELVHAGLAEAQDVKGEGAGRPTKRYRLASTGGEALRRVEARRRRELQAEMAALDELRSLIP